MSNRGSGTDTWVDRMGTAFSASHLGGVRESHSKKVVPGEGRGKDGEISSAEAAGD